ARGPDGARMLGRRGDRTLFSSLHDGKLAISSVGAAPASFDIGDDALHTSTLSRDGTLLPVYNDRASESSLHVIDTATGATPLNIDDLGGLDYVTWRDDDTLLLVYAPHHASD